MKSSDHAHPHHAHPHGLHHREDGLDTPRSGVLGLSLGSTDDFGEEQRPEMMSPMANMMTKDSSDVSGVSSSPSGNRESKRMRRQANV